MLFNSLQFLLFFLVITLGYYRLPDQRSRVWLLVIASCYFYMTFVPRYILILGSTIVIDYWAGRQIARSQGYRRKVWLVLSILANVGILAYFKYFNFLLSTFTPLAHAIFPSRHLPSGLDIVLPIGLSFHTFQAMSYTIEVYRGRYPPEKNFLIYSLYVLFYPQLVAGPIERPQNVLPQLHIYQSYDWRNVKEGLARMLWGFFKKVVIADRLAMAVDFSYDHIGTQSSTQLLVSAIFYSFQIYCDFSGYSDIGIGAAKVMGIRLMENFDEPYGSPTLPVFWTRWHISLSSWFRDYVYIPLGGNRRGRWRRKVNMLIVFLLSGLWHGANWTFVVWGGLHGLATALYPGRRERANRARDRMDAEPRSKIALLGIGSRRWLLIGGNFLLVTLLWVFFRAPSLHQAWLYLGGIFHTGDAVARQGLNGVPGSGFNGAPGSGLNGIETGLAVLLIGGMLYRERRWKGHFIQSDRRFAVYVAGMVAVCYFLGVFGENQFIYFQF